MRTRHTEWRCSGQRESTVSRRTLVSGLASILVGPVVAQTRKFRIGFISELIFPPAREALVSKLAAMGYREGDNLVVEQIAIDGQPERLPQLAREILSRGVQLVIVEGDGAALAVKAANGKMPVVLVWSLDPVQRGLAASLAHPGGNVTGLTYDEGTNQATKRLQLLKEAVPGLDTIGAPLERIRSTRPSALMWGGPALDPQVSLVAEFAIKERLPVFAVDTSWVNAGLLMAYSSNDLDRFPRVASYVHRILKGTPQASFPSSSPAASSWSST